MARGAIISDTHLPKPTLLHPQCSNSLAWGHPPSSSLNWSSCGAGAFPYLGAGPWDTVMEMSMPSPGATPRHPEGPWEGKEDSPACPRDSSKHGSADESSSENVTCNNEIKSAKQPWIALLWASLSTLQALCEERQGMLHARWDLLRVAPRYPPQGMDEPCSCTGSALCKTWPMESFRFILKDSSLWMPQAGTGSSRRKERQRGANINSLQPLSLSPCATWRSKNQEKASL